MVFDEALQEAMLARFGAWLDQGDHIARADLVLYGTQGVAAQDMVRLLPPDQQAEFKAANLLSVAGTSLPKYSLKSSGNFFKAESMSVKITPWASRVFLIEP